MIPFSSCFSCVLSASESSGEECLLSGENASRRISEGRPGERQGNKGKQGEKGRKERIRQEKEEAACRGKCGRRRRRTDSTDTKKP